ncbi:RlpA-like double-psi beta-barrel-protein domain-containing protein-containing protein [Aspergillus californicus]
MVYRLLKPVFLTATLLMGQAKSVYAGLATTTHYSDGLQGACGCGTETGTFDWQYGISENLYTAAANQAIFDQPSGMEHWCGSGCGKCYRLTSTGASSCETCGTGGAAGKSITVMVTNLCPFVGNEQWCPNPGQLNAHGYGYHFDIMGGHDVFGDNVVVEFEEVACPGLAAAKWGTCECHPDLRGKDLTDGAHAAGAGLVGPVEAAPLDGAPGAAVPAPAPAPPAAPVAPRDVAGEASETLLTMAKPAATDAAV